MVQHLKDISILDTNDQGGNSGSPLVGTIGDSLGRQLIIDSPPLNEVTYLRDVNGDISTIVTLFGGGRYFIEVYTRDATNNISHISSTTSYWTSYL